MPFVTEAIWGALPHRADDPELLIVARWPRRGASATPPPRPSVEALLELVRAIRNARAEAGSRAGRLAAASTSLVPEALGPAFEALRPAVERLARARPLDRHLTREALHAATPDGRPGGHRRRDRGRRSAAPTATVRAAAADRARLEKELAEAEGCSTAARARLANAAFTSKAPPAVVEGARRAAELSDQVARLEARLGLSPGLAGPGPDRPEPRSRTPRDPGTTVRGLWPEERWGSGATAETTRE